MANHLNKIVTSILLVACLFPLYDYGQGGIKIQSGAYFVMNNNAQLVINNAGITNNGTIMNGASTVTFTGTTATANSFTAGSAGVDFYNLVLNKAANGLILSTTTRVGNNLTFTSGDSIYLNNNILDLVGSGTIVGEAASNRITGLDGGYIQTTQTLNAPSAVNPGNMGLEITSGANLGSTIIRRGHQQQPGGSILRYYDVIPTNNSGLNASIKFSYFDNELAGNDESNLMVYSSANGGINWTFKGQDSHDITANYVIKNGFDSLNRLTLAQIGTVLTVQLLYFKAQAVNRQTLLNWAFANEINVDHYDVERSVDGINFIRVNTVKSDGKTGTTGYYESIDRSPVNGLNYYRLKVYDPSGSYFYSKMVTVKLNFTGDQGLGVYPNPATDLITVVLYSEKNQSLKFELFNENGTMINTRNIAAVTGLNNIPWDISALQAGIYNMRVIGSSTKVIRFIKH